MLFRSGLKSGPHLCTPAIRARREFLCIHFPHLLQHQHYHTVREKGSIRTNKMFPLRPSASARRAIAPQLVRRRLHKKVVPLVPAFEQAVSPRTAPDHAIFTFFQLQRFPVFSPVHSSWMEQELVRRNAEQRLCQFRRLRQQKIQIGRASCRERV